MTSNRTSKFLSRFLTRSVQAAGFALLIFAADPAAACRDCPFPHKMGYMQWMMPNGRMLVEINEAPISVHYVQMYVVLRDPDSGEVLATGSVQRRKNRYNITLTLTDRSGNRILGQVRWVDHKNQVIQAKFSCARNCAIETLVED